MVWPILPLILEGLIAYALAASVAVGIALGSFKYGLLTFLLWGVFCRVKRSFLGPQTQLKGFCSRYVHHERVAKASEAAHKPGPLRMFKATASNTFRPQQITGREESQARLDLRGFVHVLEVNQAELWCDIEASATFETYVAATLSHGVAPLVVPELRTITVGGAIVGIGIESSSFKHGFFHEGLLECDVLLASGEVVTAKPEGEYADLFAAVPNSLGSFGYLLRLRMRVQPAKPIVEIVKTCFDSAEELVNGLEEACKNKDFDYVDGVALSEAGGTLITGRFVSQVPTGSKLQRYGMYPIFYKSLVFEGTEYMTTSDYIWRWDADWFWCTQVFPGLSNPVIRWLCGSEVLRSDNYKKFNDAVISNVLQPLGLNKNEELIIQDIEIPISSSAKWIKDFLRVVPSSRIGKIKLSRPGSKEATVPIWLCPVIGTASPLMPMDSSKLYINFGFWDALEGPETKGGMAVGNINRALETLAYQYGGKKTLYSSVFLSEEDFYAQYNGKHYRGVKSKYDPTGRLRGWYERVTKP